VFVDYGRVAQPASLRHIVQYHKDIATRMQTYADPLQRTLSQVGHYHRCLFDKARLQAEMLKPCRRGRQRLYQRSLRQ